MATYTSLINTVLVKLRESTVAAPTSSAYAALIGQFINETKREVEDAWKWSALRTTVDVTTESGTQRYAITGAGNRWKFQDTPDRSVYNETRLEWIKQRSPTFMRENTLINPAVGKPYYFSLEGKDSNGAPYVDFFQTPDGAYTINFNLIVPQADFSTGSETLSVPKWPVVLGAYAKAVDERGEDGSQQASGKAEAKYASALSDAIALDEAISLGDSWYV